MEASRLLLRRHKSCCRRDLHLLHDSMNPQNLDMITFPLCPLHHRPQGGGFCGKKRLFSATSRSSPGQSTVNNHRLRRQQKDGANSSEAPDSGSIFVYDTVTFDLTVILNYHLAFRPFVFFALLRPGFQNVSESQAGISGLRRHMAPFTQHQHSLLVLKTHIC